MSFKVYRWEVGLDHFGYIFGDDLVESRQRVRAMAGNLDVAHRIEVGWREAQAISDRLREMRQGHKCKPKDGLNHTVIRAFDLLDVIAERPGMTASEIRRRIPGGSDISLRTVQRDLRALSSALPSLWRDEDDNGWRLDAASEKALRGLGCYAVESPISREIWKGLAAREEHVVMCLGADGEELRGLEEMLQGRARVVVVSRCEDFYLYDSMLQVVFPFCMSAGSREAMNECLNERGMGPLNLFILGAHEFRSPKCPGLRIFSDWDGFCSSIEKEVERLLKEERKAERCRACLADAFSILAGIRCNPGIGTVELADLCGMGVRKAKRYIDTLRAVGRPIWYDKRCGGWRYGGFRA